MVKEDPPSLPLSSLDKRIDTLREDEFNFDFSSSTTGEQPRLKPSRSVVANKQGEIDTILKVFEEIDAIAQKKVKDGLNEFNFALGVLNTIGVTYMFGHYPQHFWLVYILQSCYMLPKKFLQMWSAKPNQALYYLDFCWAMNFFGILFLASLVLVSRVNFLEVNEATRKYVFSAMIGLGAGGVTGANIILPFIALVFHDLNSMTSVFIHVMPPIVLYTFMHHRDIITDAWPGVFNLSYLDEVTFYGNQGVFECSLASYFVWWIFYVSFMLLIGLDLPRKFKKDGTPANPKWDTVFHSTLRGGACITLGNFRGRSKADSLQQMEGNDFDLIDFAIYMTLHAAGVITSTAVIGHGCFMNRHIHNATIILVLVLGVLRGGKRYAYYATMMYSKALHKEFDSIVQQRNEYCTTE